MGLNNQQGISLPAFLLIHLVLAMALIHLGQKLDLIHKTKQRAQTYLCAKSFAHETQDYLKYMAYFNQAIRVLTISSFAPPPYGPLAKKMQKALIVIQQVFHLSYLKNLATLPFCHWSLKPYFLKKAPYRNYLTGQLLRDHMGMAILKEEKWSLIIIQSPGLWLELDFSVRDSVDTSSQLTVKETTFTQDISNLKQLSGLVSWP